MPRSISDADDNLNYNSPSIGKGLLYFGKSLSENNGNNSRIWYLTKS